MKTLALLAALFVSAPLLAQGPPDYCFEKEFEVKEGSVGVNGVRWLGCYLISVSGLGNICCADPGTAYFVVRNSGANPRDVCVWLDCSTGSVSGGAGPVSSTEISLAGHTTGVVSFTNIKPGCGQTCIAYAAVRDPQHAPQGAWSILSFADPNENHVKRECNQEVCLSDSMALVDDLDFCSLETLAP